MQWYYEDTVTDIENWVLYTDIYIAVVVALPKNKVYSKAWVTTAMSFVVSF